MSVSKNDLEDLTNIQLKEIVKKTVDKLGLKVQGKNKTDLVNALDAINKGNKFYGKKLLSLDESGHIKIPKRKIRQGVKQAKKQKELKKQVEAKAAQKKILDTEISQSKKNISAGEKKLEGMKNKILNLEKREKIEKSKKDRVKRARAKYNAVIADLRKNLKGKSTAEMMEMRKKLASAKSEFDKELKEINK